MAYNVSALPDYVKQNNFPLLRKSLFGAKTAKLVSIQSGVKSSSSLNLIDNSFTFQVDGCSFDANGTTTFTQRNIVVGKIKVQEEFCPKDLEAKYTQLALQPGSHQETLPFEEVFMGLVTDQIAAKLETAAWQGDTDSGNADLNKFDGFLKIISGCTGYVTGNTISATGITVSNVRDVLNAVYAAIPIQVLDKDDLRVFVGTDIFRLWTIALTNANQFHYTSDAAQQNMEFEIPGTNVKVVAVNGLNGTNKIVAARLSNLYIGVDLESDSDDFDMWYSQDFRTVRMSVEFKYGTQVAFCDEIVFFYI